MNRLALALAAAMLSAAFTVSAAPGAGGAIYEWIDDSGRLQASDTVPDKYKRVARRVDPNRSRIPANEQAEAEREAVTLKEKAASEAPRPALVRATASSTSTRAGSFSAGPSMTDSPKCVAWRRQMAASQECFVYSSKPNGHARSGACGVQPDPEPECGPDAPR